MPLGGRRPENRLTSPFKIVRRSPPPASRRRPPGSSAPSASPCAPRATTPASSVGDERDRAGPDPAARGQRRAPTTAAARCPPIAPGRRRASLRATRARRARPATASRRRARPPRAGRRTRPADRSSARASPSATVVRAPSISTSTPSTNGLAEPAIEHRRGRPSRPRSRRPRKSRRTAEIAMPTGASESAASGPARWRGCGGGAGGACAGGDCRIWIRSRTAGSSAASISTPASASARGAASPGKSASRNTRSIRLVAAGTARLQPRRASPSQIIASRLPPAGAAPGSASRSPISMPTIRRIAASEIAGHAAVSSATVPRAACAAGVIGQRAADQRRETATAARRDRQVTRSLAAAERAHRGRAATTRVRTQVVLRARARLRVVARLAPTPPPRAPARPRRTARRARARAPRRTPPRPAAVARAPSATRARA